MENHTAAASAASTPLTPRKEVRKEHCDKEKVEVTMGNPGTSQLQLLIW
jgi:hypothetical protein